MNSYIKIRSWHVIRTWTLLPRAPGRAITLCGRVAIGPRAADFEGEKSCETCLRIAAKGY